MVDRSELWLGRHVAVRLCGGETVGAVVDGLCHDWVGVRLDRGGYVIADWEDIEVDAEEEVVRTEQGEVLARKSEEEIPNYLNEVADYARRQVEELLIVIKKYDDYSDEQIEELRTHLMAMFLEGTGWQKEQDKETIELAEEHAYLAGAVNEREKMMKEAVEGEITKDNRGNNVVRAGVFNKDFEYGDKVRVIVLKKED